MTKHPQLIPMLAWGLMGLFLVWLLASYVPIAVVEIKYQSFKLAQLITGSTNPTAIFEPNFNSINLQANSQHRDYGITIPSLNLDEPVIFNVDPNDQQAYSSALKQGIAHASGTAFPDNGGLGYYFAHSSQPDFLNQFNAVFYLLGKLKPGDEIFIWHENQRNDYIVTKQVITSPDNVGFLDHSYNNETIVLQTCWPPGLTSQRLLVFAQRQ